MYRIYPAAYCFTHQYLNTMQQGIQSAHAIANLFSLYRDTPAFDDVMDWAENHKTIIILNAGSGEAFDATFQWFGPETREAGYTFPRAVFHEPDINDMMTAMAFIMTPDMVEQINQECAEMLSVDADPEKEHLVISKLRSLRRAV